MIICIKNVLQPDEVAHIRHMINRSKFVDGKSTAGWHAALVKNNQQINPNEKSIQEIGTHISRTLMENEVFRLAARPKQLSPLLFSRYSNGMSYGAHVDDALMGNIRSDLSFTIFLTDPRDYTGGELVMDLHQGEQAFKLDAGDMILYPSTTLHRVEAVTQGTRLAAVGWAQSLIRRSDQRELLFDIETARLSLFKKDGKSSEFDLLSKSLSNLLRMWVE
jgi:PKHD-type hydroxylase